MKAQKIQLSLLTPLIRPLGIILLVGGVFTVMFLAITMGGVLGNSSLSSLFSMGTTQLWWFITRAAGLTGYFLIWLSMAWGLAIPSKIVQPLLEGTFTYDFHEHLSLLGLGFILLHIVVLLFDRFLPYNIFQLLIPFTNTYRPFWVGLGILSFYTFLVVTATFYLRSHIGTQAFRSIHLFSFVGYLGATLHGLFAGTDSSLPVTLILYAGTFLVIVFLTVYWLIVRKSEKGAAPSQTVNKRQYQRR